MTAIFTPGYAAAEQYTSAELGPWTDIYGLSATLYHAITGKIPPSAIERILKDIYQPLSELKPEGYAPELLAGVDAGMARHVDDRPAGHRRMAACAAHRRTPARGPGGDAGRAQGAPPQAQDGLRASRPRFVGLGHGCRDPAGWRRIPRLHGQRACHRRHCRSQPLGRAARAGAGRAAQGRHVRRRKAPAGRRGAAEGRSGRRGQAAGGVRAGAGPAGATEGRAGAGRAQGAHRGGPTPSRRNRTRPPWQRSGPPKRPHSARRKRTPRPCARPRKTPQKKLETDTEVKRQADEALARAEAERQQGGGTKRAPRPRPRRRRGASFGGSQAKGARSRATERLKSEARRRRPIARRPKPRRTQGGGGKAAKVKEEAETAEKALRLEPADRQRLQVALTSLGFDTRGSDGIFGPRSREMTMGWQQKVGAPTTGYVTAAQREQLLRSAAPAIARWEEEQKKAEEQKKLAEEEKKSNAAKAAAAVPPLASPAPGGPRAIPEPNVSAVPPGFTRPAQQPDANQQTTTAPIQTSVFLQRASDNISSCRLGNSLAVRLYPNRIEVQMLWGWEAFKIDADGSFSGSVSGPASSAIGNTFSLVKLSIQGNAKSKVMRIESLDYYRCAWSGTIS